MNLKEQAGCGDACGEENPSMEGGSRSRPGSRLPFFLLRLALGAVFIAASAGKIIDPGSFAKAIHNYQILPDVAINVTAIVLPWLELILGVLLIAGLWLPGAAVTANVLMVGFFGALLFNLARGVNVHCGCFSTDITGEPQTLWYIVRDSGFLLLSAGVLYGALSGRRGGKQAVQPK